MRNKEQKTGFLLASLYFLFIVFDTLLLGVPCLAIALVRPRSDASYWFIRTWADLLLWACGVRVDIGGVENIPVEGPFLVMSTHNSHFDIPVLIKAIPRQFRIVAKKVLFKIPVFGWIMSVAGYVSVDRADREQAFDSLDRAAQSVRAGMPLLIFPEGTRSPDGSLGSFKKGGFVVATKARVPIVPVVVAGTYDVLPKTTWHIRPGRVTVTFCEPIDASSYSYENKGDLMQQVREAISRALESAAESDRSTGLTTAA